MRVCVTWRLLLKCVVACSLAGLAVCVPSAFAESALGLGGTGSSPLESPLVIPEAQVLLGGESVGNIEGARRLSPEAVAARIVSATAYEGLSAEQAVKQAEESFPGLIDHPAGGPPQLPAGQTITGYLSDDAALMDLGGGRHAVIESTAPIAVESSSSAQRVPVNLGLIEAGGGFQPETPVVGVRIPKRLGEGVRLPGVGVSLTPVDGPSGAPLGGSKGSIVGATVLYANTQTDMDTVMKPTTAGFSADTFLRSVESPRQLYFRVGLPEGASLVQSKDGSGAVEVVEEGAAIATISPPGASDAAGTPVPVSMSLSGNTLMLNVADHAAEYQYPVEVDPEVKGEDSQLLVSGSKRSNWEFYTSNGKNEPGTNFASNSSCEHWGGVSLETCGVHEYKEKELAYWVYQTRGVSKIYEFEGETEASNKEDRIESVVELQHEGGLTEEKELLSNEAKGPVEYSKKPLPEPLCPKGKESCVPTSGNKENSVHFQQSVVSKPTSKFSFSDAIDSGTVYISEPEKTHSTTSDNSSSTEFEIEVENSKKEKEKEKRKNALYGSSNWLSEYDGAIQFIAKDTGIGVAKSWLEYENSGKWEAVSGSEHNYLEEGLCKGVQCESEQKEYWTLNKHLPNGEDKIRYRAEEAFGDATHETESLETEGTGTVKVDTSKPHGIVITGLPYGNELAEKTYELTTYATDGEGSTVASSGIMPIEEREKEGKKEKVKGITLSIDGYEAEEVGTQTGCSAVTGACTASAKWRISGEKLGAGHHAIVVVAKDRAGNEGRHEETISIRHSTPVPLGPGSVDLESGDFALGSSDVSLGSGLSVSRVYSSRDLTAGVERGSLLGSQWSLSLGSEESLVELVDHSVLVTSGDGGQTIFAGILNSKDEPTGKFEAPPGDSNLTMTLEENEKKEKLAYYLKDPAAGTSTKFVLSSTAKVWVPTVQEGPVPTDAVSYLYETVEVGGKKVTRPTEELAAHPKVSCSPKMEPGCRALKFTYATKTKSEIGEGPTEWGEYEGRLAKVSYEGYNPATKKMTETPIPVAEYSYDKQGRLRAEWDPRLSPHELKMTYGYDEEGHVTALTSPGQESWAFTYGAIAGDAGTGRLIKATQAPVSAGLWKGEAVKYTEAEAPKITGTPAVGVRLAVSNGAWSGSPVVYAYQWEDCNSSGGECAPIAGATNQNYTPAGTDVGHTLVARVSATNGEGSVAVASAASTGVSAIAGTYKEAVDGGYSLNAVSCIPSTTTCVLSDSKVGSTVVYATNVSSTVAASWKTWSGPVGEAPSQAVDCLPTLRCLLAAGKTSAGGNLYYAKELGGSFTRALEPSYGVDAISCPASSICVAGQDGDGYFSYSTAPISPWEFTEKQGSAAMKSVFCLSSSFCTIADSKGNVHVATSTSQIESSSWKETDVDGSSELNGIACTSTTSCVAVDQKGNELNLTIESNGAAAASKHDIDGSVPLSAVTCTGSTTCVAVDVDGNVFVSKNGGESWTNQYSLGDDLTSVSCASSSLCTTGDTLGKATAFSPGREITEGEASPPQPGTTIDYKVPLEGSSAAAQMGINPTTKKPEPEQWGQKEEEDPVEATSIFPPDSSQGWPASSYTRATTYYLDEEGRVVNTATPSTGKYGSISTTEYNETNDVVRTLSPDNRATALEAGTKSEEVASLLSTFSTYKSKCSKESEFNEERESTESGTRLCETEGPAHAVKYMAGKEQKEAPYARAHARYFYDEKVPSEGPDKESFASEAFDLMTESKGLTEIVNSKGGVEQEVEPRTTVTSYSGQNNLGWKLREPTSVTNAAESEGAKITHTTLYNENGQITETRGPEGSAGESAHDSEIVYYSEEENKEHTTCGKHPEWAGLVCETLPAKQPAETTGLPSLPVTTTTYNIWDEPETIVETFPKTATFGEKTRTKKEEYDPAGRLKSSEETSTASTESTDKALPKVIEEYNSATGILEKQSTTAGETTKTITSKYNTLGQLETYTDSDGNTTTFKYAGPENDGLLEEMSDGSDQGKSSQKYTYSETTKQLTKLVDSAAGTFTASYDTEGELVSEVYPNGMCANYTDNSVGEATHIEYTKTASCAEKEGVWFSETRSPSVRGETMSRTSTLAKEEYAYDTLGRLTEAQETPAGEYCKVRIYAYDEESNRTSLTSREPNSKKECATEGGTTEKHTYDEANRLTDSGIAYDPLGNITKLPAGDAEGHALESTFYVDNAVATQTQNGVTNDYYLDPDGRVRETATGSKKVITHYDGEGEAVAWTSEGSGETEKWTRNIPGIDGTLTAIEKGEGKAGETSILQLHDLKGDIVATIKDKTGETKLESTYNSTEFGVPNGGKEPPKYAWLGAGDVERSLASGVITEGVTSYVPQTGRALQSEEVAPPGLPEGSGGAAANFQASPWNMQGAERVGAEAPGLEAGREIEAAEAACRANPESCSEDPSWSGDISFSVAEAISGVVDGIEIANAVDGDSAGEKVAELLAQYLHVNFVTQLKNIIEAGLFNYTKEDVENWVFGIGTLLGTCSGGNKSSRSKVAGSHCWLYFPTVRRHAYKGGPEYEIPNFGASIGWEKAGDVQVGYCPYGTYSRCYNVNSF